MDRYIKQQSLFQTSFITKDVQDTAFKFLFNYSCLPIFLFFSVRKLLRNCLNVSYERLLSAILLGITKDEIIFTFN